MGKIVKLKSSDPVPTGAKFLHAKDEKEVIGVRYQEEPDFLADFFPVIWSNPVSRVTSYKTVTYFYYEVT